MKQLLFFLIYTYCFYLNSLNIEKLVNLNYGWSIFFLNENNIIITEKNGFIKLYDFKTKSIKNIVHNLNITSSGQGALMDIISHHGKIFVSYSENMPNGSTTSVATGIIKNNQIILDIGCGTGQTSYYAKKKVGINGNITAVDISTPLLKVFKKKC